jgi:hypothetical protein
MPNPIDTVSALKLLEELRVSAISELNSKFDALEAALKDVGGIVLEPRNRVKLESAAIAEHSRAAHEASILAAHEVFFSQNVPAAEDGATVFGPNWDKAPDGPPGEIPPPRNPDPFGLESNYESDKYVDPGPMDEPDELDHSPTVIPPAPADFEEGNKSLFFQDACKQLLAYLRTQPEGATMGSIFKEMPNEVLARSCIKWTLADGRIVRTGAKRGTRYHLPANPLIAGSSLR